MRADGKKLTPVDAAGWQKTRHQPQNWFYIKASGGLENSPGRRVWARERAFCECVERREFTVGAIPAPHCSKRAVWQQVPHTHTSAGAIFRPNIFIYFAAQKLGVSFSAGGGRRGPLFGRRPQKGGGASCTWVQYFIVASRRRDGWLVWDRPKFCAPSKMHGSVSARWIIHLEPLPDYNNLVAGIRSREKYREKQQNTTLAGSCLLVQQWTTRKRRRIHMKNAKITRVCVLSFQHSQQIFGFVSGQKTKTTGKDENWLRSCFVFWRRSREKISSTCKQQQWDRERER